MMRSIMRTSLLCLAMVVCLRAQAPAPKPNEAATPAVPPAKGEGVHALTREDLTAFFDGMFPIQLDRSDIAGAVVVVVRQNDVLLEKGYGYADVAKKIRVDPAVTGFRPGSISKLFTWISVMQLKEQGKVDLDADVNRYLDFRIAEPWHKPVTLRDLMTHRPGFEEEIRDLIRGAPATFIPLRQYLVENQPAQIFPPGTVPAYSNYGAGLAGYVVQRVSGERYEDYVRRHIFEPLGMSGSSFEQPLPKNWPAHPAAGYSRAENKMLPFEVVEPAPAGALTTTGADMIRFARALYYGGELDGHRILQADTLKETWTPQYRANPALPAICLGFYQQVRDGTRWIGHGGDLIAYHSLFMIQPETQTALFVSYNSAGTDRGVSVERAELFNEFVDRYYGPAKDLPTVAKGTPAAEVAGVWWSTRRGVTNRLQLGNLTGQQTASVDKEGRLVIADAKSINGETIHWKPAGPDLWVYPEGQRHLAVIRDAHGHILRAASDFPAVQSERVPWYAQTRPNMILLWSSLFAMACVLWAAVLRLIQRRNIPRAEAPLRRLRRAQVAASVAWLAILGGMVALLNHLNDPDTFPPSHAWDRIFLAMNIVVWIAVLLSVWMIVVLVVVWPVLPRRLWLRVRMPLIALAAVFLIWFSFYWKLIGPVARF
ncbi:MAG TPA: serine hydrolase domain-containing protein [Bryobacteraceae bacterium]|nr:serine hydrolase domain-containing protein [Bryobacteraceae bacterium]